LEQIAFAPSEEENGMQIYLKGYGSIKIPLPAGKNLKKTRVMDENGKKLKHQIKEDTLILSLNEESSEGWLTLTW